MLFGSSSSASLAIDSGFWIIGQKQCFSSATNVSFSAIASIDQRFRHDHSFLLRSTEAVQRNRLPIAGRRQLILIITVSTSFFARDRRAAPPAMVAITPP